MVYDHSGRRYTIIIGISDKGYNIQSVDFDIEQNERLIIVFGSVKDLELAFSKSRSLKHKACVDKFDYYVNCCPHQCCRTIRTEEALAIVLTSLKNKLGLSWLDFDLDWSMLALTLRQE